MEVVWEIKDALARPIAGALVLVNSPTAGFLSFATDESGFASVHLPEFEPVTVTVQSSYGHEDVAFVAIPDGLLYTGVTGRDAHTADLGSSPAR